MKRLLMGLLCLVWLQGCASPSANLIRSSQGGPSAAESVVVLKLHGEGPGILFGIGTGGWGLNSAMREENTQRHFYLFGSETRYMAFHIPAGTYSFLHYSPRHFIVVQEPLLDLPYSPTASIPVRPITVPPGKVIYLGDLTVHGIGFEQVVTANQPGVAYSVDFNEALARAAVDKAYPGRGAEMTTVPFVIEPAAVFKPKS
jgi:hypothetical protein